MKTFLRQDAQNRSLRTLLTGLTFDVLVAVGLVLYNAFKDADNWSAFDWKLLGFFLVKTVVVSGFSYLLRTVVDQSRIPTPLPPEYPGEPNEDGPVVIGEGGYIPTWLAVLIAVLVILAILFLLGIRVNVG